MKDGKLVPKGKKEDRQGWPVEYMPPAAQANDFWGGKNFWGDGQD